MGVTTLWDLIRGDAESNRTDKCYTTHTLNTWNSHLTYPTLAIDVSVWVLEGITIAQRINAARGEQTMSANYYVDMIVRRTIALLRHNYKLIFVCDGKPPANKRSAGQRSKNDNGTSNVHVAGDRTTSTYWKRCYNTLKPILLNLNCRVIELTIGESEAYAARLCRDGVCDAVITSDVDCFVFGATHVLRDFDQKHRAHCRSFDRDKVLRKMGIGDHQLVAMAVLLKSDYSSGVRNMGKIKCVEFVQCFDDDTIMDNLRDILTGDCVAATESESKQVHIDFDQLADDELKLYCEQHGLLYQKTARKRWLARLNKMQDAINRNCEPPPTDFYLRSCERLKSAFSLQTFDAIVKDYTEPRIVVSNAQQQLHVYDMIDLSTVYESRCMYAMSFEKLKTLCIALYCTQVLYKLHSGELNLKHKADQLYFVPTDVTKIKTEQSQKYCHVNWQLTTVGSQILGQYFSDNDSTVYTMVEQANTEDVVQLSDDDDADSIDSTAVQVGAAQDNTDEVICTDRFMKVVNLADHEELVKAAIPDLYNAHVAAVAATKQDKVKAKQVVKQQVKDTHVQQKLDFKAAKQLDVHVAAYSKVMSAQINQKAVQLETAVRHVESTDQQAKVNADDKLEPKVDATFASPKITGIKSFFKATKTEDVVNLISSDKKAKTATLSPSKRKSAQKSESDGKKQAAIKQRSLGDSFNDKGEDALNNSVIEIE